MNRVEPQDVKEAYEKHNLKPIQREWKKDYCHVCAISALVYEDKEVFNQLYDGMDTKEILEIISTKLNLDITYFSGFINGFDDYKIFVTNDIVKYNLGYEDGQKTWELVKNLV